MSSTVFSEVFYTFLITSVIGCILTTCRMMYKSKCSEINMCCLKIIRDTANEEKIDEINIQNNKNSSKDEESIN